MTRSRCITITTYAVLLGAAALTCLLPDDLGVPTVSATTPDELTIIGVVRDFRQTHPDFDVVPAGGLGHYAETIAGELPPGERPTITTGAAYLFSPAPGHGLASTGGLSIEGPGTVVDAFDSRLGPYGGLNAGLAATISSNATSSNIISLANAAITGDVLVGPGGDTGTAIKLNGATVGGETGALDAPVTLDPVTVPGALGTGGGDANFIGGVHTIDADLQCGKLAIDAGATVWIDGNVRIYCEGEFKIANGSELKLHPGATLDVYTDQDLKVENGSWVNRDPGDPTRVRALVTGSGTIKVDGNSELWAEALAPAGKADIGSSHVYGTLAAGTVTAKDASGIHVDLASATAGAAAKGYKVLSQWLDENGNPIAERVSESNASPGGGGLGGIHVKTTLALDEGTFDSFDSTLGPYGPGNSGGDAMEISTNSTAGIAVSISSSVTVNGDVFVGPGGDPGVVVDNSGTVTGAIDTLDAEYPMPTVVIPSDAEVGPLGPAVQYKTDPVFIDSNMHVAGLRIATECVVTITDTVTILVEGDFITETKGSLLVAPGASLDLYVTGDVTLKTESQWSNPSNTRIHVLGSPQFKIETKAAFYGTVIAPDADILIKTEGSVYGSIIANSLICNKGSIHIDVGSADFTGGGGGGGGGTLFGEPPAVCAGLDDTAGTKGSTDTGGIQSDATFQEWYRDVPSTNLSVAHEITLFRNAGVWEYLDDAFFPIDDRLFGNEGKPHNTFFTYQFAATFEYTECVGQFFEFEGGDGAWMYIDDIRVLDLGGVAPGTGQYVAFDRLGLTDGETYTMRFYYAQRRPDEARFRLRTNVDLVTAAQVATGSAAFD